MNLKRIMMAFCLIQLFCLCGCANNLPIGKTPSSNEEIIKIVEETKSSWDEGNKKYYAYQKENGDVVVDWFPEHFVHSQMGFNNSPQKYVNGYAYVLCVQDSYMGDPNLVTFWIVDEQGQKIVDKEYYMGFSKNSVTHNITDYYYEDFDEFGYSYFQDNDGIVYSINSTSKEVIKISENQFGHFESMGKRVYSLSDKYILVGRDTVVDRKGNVVVNLFDTISSTPINVEVVDNENFEVLFTGKDDNKYVCIIDANGKFVEEPHQYGK